MILAVFDYICIIDWNKHEKTMLPKAKEIVDFADLKMQDAVDFLEEDLKNYRVGKASPAIFNAVTVDYYGTATPLNQVASITTPDAKTIAIQPWERSMISKIEKAILDANVGLTRTVAASSSRRPRRRARLRR